MPPRHRPRRPQSRTNASSDSADPGAALPVEDRLGGPLHRLVGPPALELPGDPGQPGAEAEHLDPGRRALGRVGELQQVARVVGHRPRDVEDQDQRPQPQPAPTPVQLGRLAVRAHRLADRTPQVGPSTGRRRPSCAGCAGCGGVSRIVFMIWRRAASSSGVQAANDLARSVAASEATRPRRASRSSRRSRPGLGLGHLQHRLGLGLGLDGEGFCLVRLVALVEEEAAEHPVVRRDLVAARDQGAAAGPVEVEQVGRVERCRRLRSRSARRRSRPARPRPRSSRAKSTSVRTKASSSGTLRRPQAPEAISSRLARTSSRSSRSLTTAPRVSDDRPRVELGLAEHLEGAHPVDRLGDAGRLGQVEVAQPVDGGDHLAGQRFRHRGSRTRTISTSRSALG